MDKIIIVISLILGLIFNTSFAQADEEYLLTLKKRYSVSGSPLPEGWKRGDKDHISFLEENIKNKEKLLELIKMANNKEVGLELSIASATLTGIFGASATVVTFVDVKKEVKKQVLEALKFGDLANKKKLVLKVTFKTPATYVAIPFTVLFITSGTTFANYEGELTILNYFSKKQYEKYEKLNNANNRDPLVVSRDFLDIKTARNPFVYLDPIDTESLENSIEEDKLQLTIIKEYKKLMDESGV